MKIICTNAEAAILIRNCNMETCEFCFMNDLCHEYTDRGTISNLIEIDKGNRMEASK